MSIASLLFKNIPSSTIAVKYGVLPASPCISMQPVDSIDVVTTQPVVIPIVNTVQPAVQHTIQPTTSNIVITPPASVEQPSNTILSTPVALPQTDVAQSNYLQHPLIKFLKEFI